MSTILSRIEEIAKNEGIGISILERNIGASKGVLSRAINKGTDIQAKWLQRIVENYPQYSEGWLLAGRGEMLRTTDNAMGRFIQTDDTIKYKIREELLKEQLKEKEQEIYRLREELLLMKDKGERGGVPQFHFMSSPMHNVPDIPETDNDVEEGMNQTIPDQERPSTKKRKPLA